MFLTTEYGENFGKTKECKKLKGIFEVIGDLNYIQQIATKKPELLIYDKDTNKAITTKPENLQAYINSCKCENKSLKDYKLIFVEI